MFFRLFSCLFIFLFMFELFWGAGLGFLDVGFGMFVVLLWFLRFRVGLVWFFWSERFCFGLKGGVRFGFLRCCFGFVGLYGVGGRVLACFFPSPGHYKRSCETVRLVEHWAHRRI